MSKPRSIQRVLIAGGGTGGHVFPALALADALRAHDPQVQIQFVGAKGGREMHWVAQAGYPIQGVWISGYYRQKSLRNLLRNALLPLKLVVAHLQSYRILRRFRPDVVIGVGGYASYTTLGVASRMRGILRVIHEQNAYPGLTNRTHGRRAHLILLGYADALPYFPHGRAVVTGNPVRSAVLSAQPNAAAFGLQAGRPTVFVTGGSLGARSLNEALAAGAEALAQAGIQLLWQCGTGYYEQYKAYASETIRVLPFVADMGAAYAVADLVVCRAGALTLAELQALRKPAILVPSPNVADDHQTRNAQSLVQLGGARLLPDAQAPTQLVPQLIQLAKDPEQLARLGQAMAVPATPAATAMVQAIQRQWQLQADDPFGPGKAVYCIGIGGIGMSALARQLQAQGCSLRGYDRSETPLTRRLAAEGMQLVYEPNPVQNLQGIDSVIYTPAVGEAQPDLLAARAQGLPVWKRAQVLGRIARSHSTLAVAGTHGKTSTSSLLGYLLTEAGLDPTCFVGGIMANYDTNFRAGGSPWLVAEADEYDRSFLQLYPRHLILTSLDPDHLDIYGQVQALHQSYNQLLAQVAPGGTIVAHESTRPFIHSHPQQRLLFYGIDSGNVRAEDVHYAGVRTHFTYVQAGLRIPGLVLNRPGAYNLLNALAAICLALEAGVAPEQIRQLLPDFRGVKRRFELQIDTADLVYVDDYAHHPAEIDACLNAVKAAWPKHQIVALFQPHLFSRTRDFYQEFGRSLSQADWVYLMHIYPARELSIPNVTVDLIYQQITHEHRQIINLQEAADAILPALSRPTVVVSMGAGDIDTQVPAIRQKLLTLLPKA
ncbi:MAG: UDP-N-acetylmuramate--L-alanine ligase [Bacteroidetes bacterium]|jgi:UDP-N-acetylmuramate--alanine ligase|nr:UDP-N-acetylmuramate--L-alanine ligase [Bacteroidota bacterium]